MERLEALSKMILDKAAALGADMAQCTVAETEKKEFNVDGGEFSLMRTLFDRSVSITTFKDKKKGTVALNSFEEEKILNAVAGCIASSESSQADDAWEIASTPCEKEFRDGAPEADLDKLFMCTEELLNDVRKRHPKIMMEQMITEHDHVRSIYANSFGTVYKKDSGAYSFSLMYSAHEGEKGSSFYGSDVRTDNLDRPVIECALIDKELTDVENQIESQPVEGKFTGTVLYMPGCLAGDVIGDYSFDHELNTGDRLVFEDMAIYSMVKNNTFNGMPLPDIDILHENGDVEVIKRFSYSDFKERL